MTDDREKDRALFELMLLHQLLLERFKLYQINEFNPVLRAATKELNYNLSDLNYDNLREVPRRELNQLISRINNLDIYDDYVEEQLETMHRLSKIETVGILGLVRSVLPNNRIREPNPEIIWAHTRNEPIAATGNLLTTSLKHFIDKISDQIAQIIRSGYAASIPISQLRRQIIGTSANNFRDGLFSRIKKWNDALINSVIQHVTTIASEDIGSLAYDSYEWSALLDEVTCAVCYDLDTQIFKFGAGPRSPIHYNCRCMMIPTFGTGFVVPPFNDWLDQQTAEFKRSLMRPLSLSEYEDELSGLLEGV